METTREYLTIRRKLSQIVDSLAATVDPAKLAQKLLEVDLITDDVVDRASVSRVPTRERIQAIMMAVMAQIQLDMSNFEVLLGELRTLQPHLVQNLEKFYSSDLELNVVSATTDVHDWQALAQQLDYDPIHQQELQTSGRNPDLCRKEMLTTWARKDQRASWEKLAEALDRMKQDQVAQKIREEFIPHQDRFEQTDGNEIDPSTPTPAISTYGDYIRGIYTCRLLPYESKYSPESAQKYINLAMISKQKESRAEWDTFTRATIRGDVNDVVDVKTAIKLQYIGRLEDGSHARCILIQGAPGVGKTTLAWELCRKWGEGTLFSEYLLVVLLKMRDRSIQKATTLSDLFVHPDPELQAAVCKDVVKRNGKSILILLEGYDELPPDLQERSIFSALIEGKELPNATILVTSRISSSDIVFEKCKNRNFQHIQVVGFTKEQINRYIRNVVADEKVLEAFRHYLKKYPHIFNLMYIPLNCGIIVDVFISSSDDEEPPTTQTELYTILIKTILCRYLSSHPVHGKKKWRLSGFTDLPQDVYLFFLQLCKIAYEGTLSNRWIFSDIPAGQETLGLMQSVPELYESKGVNAVSHNFLHLTLQEYLSAVHISTFSQHDFVKALESMFRKKHLTVVLQFLAGLTKFVPQKRSSFTDKARALFKKSPIQCVKLLQRDALGFINTMHWLFEAQEKELLSQVLGRNIQDRNLSSQFLRPFDCYALGYLLANSQCKWRLNLKSCSITEEGMNMFASHGDGSFRSVAVLNLDRNIIANQGGTSLSMALKGSAVLSELRLGLCSIGSEGITKLTETLKTIRTLRVLDISGSTVGLTAGKNFAQIVSDGNLSELNISYCSIESSTTCDLARALYDNSQLQDLWLRGNPIGEAGAEAIAGMLQCNNCLKLLDLTGCMSIGETAVRKLIAVMCQNASLELLYLPDNLESSGRATQDYDMVQSRIQWTEDSFGIDKKILEEAMKEGYVNASFLKVIFTGGGGVGKTHAICLLRGADPPDPNYRQSTDCVTKAVTLRVDAANSEYWEEIDLEKRRKIIAKIICAAKESAKIKREQQPVSTPSSSQEPLKLQPQQQTEPEPELEHKAQDPEPQPEIEQEQQSPPQSMTTPVSSQPLETELDLAKSIHEAIMSGEVSGEILGTKWVYAVDTGGQPPFHDLLSAFIKGASACVFVFKLSESLDHRPLIEYWVDGRKVGEPFEHPLSNRQILEQGIQTIQALPYLSDEHPTNPLLFTIGTHRDEQDKCTDEKLEDKERILHDIMKQSGCNFQCYAHNGEQRVVFDVNSKKPEQRDKVIASILRREIANIMPEPHKIPLRLYGLELELEHRAATKGVISMEECCEIGGRLNFDEERLKAALRFLHSLNALLYFPEVKEVEKLIFCDPLLLIKIVSKVVAHINRIKHQCEGATKQWENSCERGLITVEQLSTDEFRSHFQSDIFTPKHFFKLCQHLLIVAVVNEKDQLFFMPCLLDDTTKITRPTCEYYSPLTFQFFKEGKPVYAPSGLFSALVAFLLSFKNRFSKGCSWTITESGGSVYRNSITFHSRSPPADITLLNFHTSFEVFANCRPNYLHKCLPEIRNIMLKGLEEAKKVRNFQHVDYNEAFTCKCSKAANKEHLAEINVGEKSWSCPHDTMEGGSLETNELVWYGVNPPIPQITEEPNSIENAAPGKPIEFVVKAVGKNLTYTWHRQTVKQLSPKDKRVLVGETQILHIGKVELNDEGYYLCTICNPTGGRVETKPAQLTTLPQITEEPDSLENATLGKPARFVVKAVGKNLTYTWYCQTAKQLSPKDERVFLGNTQVLHIDRVDSSDEGYYVCTICNPTGGSVETLPAQLTTVPQITEEANSIENAAPGKSIEFVVKAVGKNLTYTWHRQTVKRLSPKDKRVLVGETQILHIDNVKSNDEGYYVCTICNPTGGRVETKPAQLTTLPQITEEPDSLENATLGKPAKFVVNAVGKNLTYTWYCQTVKQLSPKDKRVLVGETQILHIDNVESNDEGYYVCTICNPTGGRVATKPAQLTTLPQITEEPDSLENTTLGKPAKFVVKAVGKNLTYTWYCQTGKQLSPKDKRVFLVNTQVLLIDRVDSSDEGYYVCTICNPTGGSVETLPAQLTTVPQITEEPNSMENAAPGKPIEFVVKAVGKNLTYTWHRQTVKRLSPKDKRVLVGETQILHIDNVKSNDEGYYVCTICNPTGGRVETKPAQLTTLPQITEEPDSLENATLGKPAKFVVKAVGKNLTYTWHRQTVKRLSPKDKRVLVGETQILHIDNVKSNDEGYYVCTICNPTGGRVETKPAQLTTLPQITEEPDSLENATLGKPAKFVVKAVGKNLTYTWYCQTAKQLSPKDKRVLVGETQILHIDNVESNDEGYYVCTICNPTGGRVETKPAQLTTLPQITEEPDSLENATPGKPAKFVVKAVGKNLTYTWHRQTAEDLQPKDKRVFLGNYRVLHIDRVDSSDEGYYVCTVCNPTGGSVETKPARLTTTLWSKYRRLVVVSAVHL